MMQYWLAIICGFLELAVIWILFFPSVCQYSVVIGTCSDSALYQHVQQPNILLLLSATSAFISQIQKKKIP
jgi:hypothetical protein